jgi:hypothetical protein
VLSKRFHLEFLDIYACGNSDKMSIRQTALRNCVETINRMAAAYGKMWRTGVWYKMSIIEMIY